MACLVIIFQQLVKAKSNPGKFVFLLIYLVILQCLVRNICWLYNVFGGSVPITLSMCNSLNKLTLWATDRRLDYCMDLKHALQHGAMPYIKYFERKRCFSNNSWSSHFFGGILTSMNYSKSFFTVILFAFFTKWTGFIFDYRFDLQLEAWVVDVYVLCGTAIMQKFTQCA